MINNFSLYLQNMILFKMALFNTQNKVLLQAIALVATFCMFAACEDPYKDEFRVNTNNPEIKRPENATLADIPNHRRVLIVFSLGYNDLSADLKEDIKDMISNNVPEYGFEENVLLILNQNTSTGYNYSIPTSPVLTHIYTRGEKIIQDTLKVYADTTIAARKAVVNDVLNIAKERFPAKSYGMILSSHGTGWAPEGYCYSPPDKTKGSVSDSDSYTSDITDKYNKERSIGSHFNGGPARAIEIEIPDLADAIPMHIDYILFDACFMGGIEVAYELKDKCDLMCFSQTEILSNGMDYNTLLSILFSEDDIDITRCAESYYDMYKNQSSSIMRSATISVVDCRKLHNLAQVVANNSKAIISLAANAYNRKKVQGYFQPKNSRYHGIFYDLESIFKESGASAETMSQLQDALAECVACKYATPTFLNAFDIKTHSGLSMYLPDSDRYILNDYYKTLKWNNATHIVE